MAKDMKHIMAEVERLLNEDCPVGQIQQVLDLTTAEIQKAVYLCLAKKAVEVLQRAALKPKETINEVAEIIEVGTQALLEERDPPQPPPNLNTREGLVPAKRAGRKQDKEKWHDDTDD